MRSNSDEIKTKSVVRPSKTQTMILNLEAADLGVSSVEDGILRFSND